MATKRAMIFGLILFVVSMLVYLMKQTPPGSSASKEVPDFPLPLAAPAEPTTMAGLRGKVVVLDFWATWCEPCKISMPHLEAIYKKYKDRGLMVIGLSEDDGSLRSKVEATRKQLGVTYPTALATDIDGISRIFPHQGIPALYLIDKGGQIVNSEEGFSEETMQELDHKIDELLKK